ncbi:MAG: glycine cleavage system aminomethyltransferase GcvT [Planctomycetales bacterium]
MLRTACHDWHAAHGGRMVDFAGWHMPVQYTTIVEEHHAVRRAAGLFDITHMGRLKFSGPDACACLDRLLTNDVAQLQIGQIRYSLVCHERGGILDDVLVYRFSEHYLLVVNASNRLKIIEWVEAHIGGCDVHFEDQTFDHFMCAIQGPKAIDILHPLVDSHDIRETAYYWGAEGSALNVPALISRTGYTGEDGFEIVLPVEHGPRLWETLIDRGREHGLLPAGLGCRDTLRLEAAMPLYGHEMDEAVDPYTAGLAFGVKLQKVADFIGKEALVAAKAREDRPKRVGLELAGRRIAREGALLFAGDRAIGKITSGTFSPTLEKPIAMGFVPAEFSQPGTPLEVDVRGKREQAKVVPLPFYKRG